MTQKDPYLPEAILDNRLRHNIQGHHSINYQYKYPCIPKDFKIDLMDDRDVTPFDKMCFKYGHNIVTSDLGIYYLNRLQQYYDNNYGMSQVTVPQHIQTMIDTYPILKEKWDEFYALLILCDGHVEERRGKF